MLIDHPQLPQALDSLDLSDITGIGARMLIRLKNHGILDVVIFAKPTEPHCIVFGGRLKEDRFWYALRGIALPEQVRANVVLGIPTFCRQSLEPSLELFPHYTECSKKPAACANNYFTGHLILQVKFGFEWRWGKKFAAHLLRIP